MANIQKTFKILLVGDGGVGKSSFLGRLLGLSFKQTYHPTLGVNVEPIQFSYKKGNGEKGYIVFNIWDCAGQPKYKGLGDGYYIQSDAVIYMFDGSNALMPYDSGPLSIIKWQEEVERVIGTEAPSVIVANKCDKLSSQLHPDILVANGKSMKNIYTPFKILAQKLLKDDSITISQITQLNSTIKEVEENVTDEKRIDPNEVIVDDFLSHIDIIVKPKTRVKIEKDDETLTIHNDLIYDDWYEPSNITVRESSSTGMRRDDRVSSQSEHHSGHGSPKTSHFSKSSSTDASFVETYQVDVPSDTFKFTTYHEEIEELKKNITELNNFKNSIPRILDDLESNILKEVHVRVNFNNT